MGEIYKVAGENEKWEEYLKKAYQLIDCEKCAGISAVAAIYNDMGGIEEGKGNYKQALLYYDTLILFGKENNYDKAIGVALSNSATIHKLIGNNEKIVVSKSIGEFEELLADFSFFRPHQSFLVNLNHVKKIDKSDGGFIVMKNKKEIPISIRQKKKLISLLENL